MEAQSNISDGYGNDKNFSWSSATNWTIAGGSLDASITFETSDSLIDTEIIDSKRKPPLVLQPSSANCGPCEINISFAQKHEVRQVYVRSTARVYEIYFAPSLRSSNEYLCTVRCGIAARDDEVLQPIDIEEPCDAQSKGSATELPKEKCNDDGNIVSSEDDWVEVKVPDSSLQDYENNSKLKRTDANPGTSLQDFYEATAEISDADACTSLTIRLLSLQSKGCLYVDEIFVFADLVESADSETQVLQVGNSLGSSFMAMLAPTLVQLSKTGIDQRQDKHSSDTRGKGQYLEIGSKTTDPNNTGNKVQHKESIDEATPEPPQMQIPPQVSDRDQRHDSVAKTDVSYDRVGRALEQLVSRVNRIEDICLRFEENMLKPISSIEARLQQVEQQVELLAKNSQYSGFPSCMRISAPAFSSNGSNSSLFSNKGSDYPACGAMYFEKKDFPSDELLNNPDDMSVSVNDTRFLPSLIVTAPEFSCGEDEESDDALEPPEDCPQETVKQAMSIDDALAAALAGFLSTTSVHPPNFTIEENGNDGEVASLNAESDNPIVPPIFSCEINGMECTNDPISTFSGNTSILTMGKYMENLDDFEQTDGCQIVESTCREEANNEINLSVSGNTHIERQFPQSQAQDIAEILHEETAASAEDLEEVSAEDVFPTVLISSCTSFAVDFELPILDVKFGSRETSDAKSPLESLLMPELEVEAPSIRQRGDDDDDDDAIGWQSNLFMENGELNSPVTGDRLLVDWDSNDGRHAPSSVEVEAPEDSYVCNNQVIFASLI